MRIPVAILLCLLFALHMNAQVVREVSLLKEIEVDGDNVYADNLGHIYVLSGNELSKFDSGGELAFAYSNNILGEINYCDVSNPFKILLLYKSTNTIVFLDKSLSVSSEEIGLENIGLYDVEVACNSARGGFWVFDIDRQELICLDNALSEKLSSGNINQLIDKDISPIYIKEKGKYIYIVDQHKGIFIFDSFANFYKKIPEKGIRNFWVLENHLVFFKSGTLHFLHKNMLNEFEISIPDKQIESICLENGLLYVLVNRKLKIYKFYKQ